MSRDSKGKFAKGNPGKPKGSKNKQTKEVRERFKCLLEDNLDTLGSDLRALKPKERVDAILSLAKYVIPTLRSADMKLEDISENKFKPIEVIERVIVEE